VILKASVEVEGQAKAADYAFRMGDKTLFFVKAKKPAVNIKTNPEPALWTFVDHEGIKPTDNAAERPLRWGVFVEKTLFWHPSRTRQPLFAVRSAVKAND
jgi:hypothetical protein